MANQEALVGRGAVVWAGVSWKGSGRSWCAPVLWSMGETRSSSWRMEHTAKVCWAMTCGDPHGENIYRKLGTGRLKILAWTS